MKSIVLQLLICGFVSQTSSAGNELPLKPEVPLDIGSYRGTAILSSHIAIYNQQDIFTADIRFINRGIGSYFYNPFFDTLIPLPAQVALFDRNGSFIRDMIGRVHKSRRGFDTDSWTWIPGDRYVGGDLPVSFAGIPAGSYLLQVIFFPCFISSRPTEKALSEHSWDPYSKPDLASTSELFRSNVISLVVKDGKAAQQAEPPATKPTVKGSAEVQPPTPTPKVGPQ